MSNCRYHIHVICADNDQLLVLDSLSIFFQSRAFLTHDVSSKLPKASLYGRQCIDSCDYALMIIGDSYGTVQKTGVSQMHLSYLNAKAKLKPLLIFIKNHHQDANISRQLQEFIKSVTRQDNELYYYDTENDIEQLLVQAYYNVVSNHKVSGGWVRASEEMIKFSQQTVAERFADLLATNKANNQDSNADDELIADKVSRPIVLMEAFDVKYSAQAYEGGNLTDVSRTMLLTWREILVVLMNIPSPFSSYGLQNAINRLIASKAERDIKKDMPNVHAVSRCQIFQDDLNNLQRQLVAASWIQLTTYGTRVSQELWKLTAYAKNLLSNEDI
ncbi:MULTISPECIES: DUF4062 domain-containing protein [Psychrobacter]|uniref:DUF4062 domain-containing protein n=1 Tax=Psychrobacter TaxID=497 RepID=UPI0018DFF8A7|nr:MULTISPECIES: DUF4062 domain-containing protein [Psychrobacter]